MKKTCWTFFCAVLSTALLAQSPAAVETPAAAPALTNASLSENTNAAAAKPVKKKSPKKKTANPATVRKKDADADLRSVPLLPGPATVIAGNVNVRGQAGLKGEVITHVTKGQPVTVLEEITLKKSAPDEPSAWARIVFPTNAHVWINGSFIDVSNKTVIPKKLNVRGGPGENFSVLGALKRGDAVKDFGAKGDWLEIEPPPDTYAFVAAQYLKQEAPAMPTLAGATEPAPTPATVAETAPIPTAPTETPVPAPTESASAAPATTAPAPTAPPIEEPPPKRIVQREGIVRGTISIQAPTEFELISPDNGRTINYLHTTARDLDLRRYKGMRIVVTGEEGLDERWRNTPVLTIQRLQVIE